MRKVWLILLLGMMLVDSGCVTNESSGPKWRSIVIEPRKDAPRIRWYDKVDPIWWLGNVNEPKPPAWYRPGKSKSLRWLSWHLRNPLSNLCDYVIGVEDKKTVRIGRYPTADNKSGDGWDCAVTRWHIIYLPFVDYRHGRFEFYFGWRERGNFGIKLNLRQALPKSAVKAS